MDAPLGPIEVRILGSLIEKQVTTPDYYPLSLNALDLACNQTTNRDPVTSYDGGSIEQALERLRQKGLVWVVRGGRAIKYDQRLGEKLQLAPREMATMCVLMLRGPQTAGEIRGRTGRLFEFPDLEAVDASLEALMQRDPPLVAKLPRLPGTKEPRCAQLLGGEIVGGGGGVGGGEAAAAVEPRPIEAPVDSGKIAQLEQEIATLRGEVTELRAELQALKRQFE